MQRSTELARRVVVDLGADVPNVLRRFSPPMSSSALRLQELVEEGVRRGIPDGCVAYHGEERIEDDESLRRLIFPGFNSIHAESTSGSSSSAPNQGPLVVTLRQPCSVFDSYHSLSNSKIDDGWIIAHQVDVDGNSIDRKSVECKSVGGTSGEDEFHTPQQLETVAAGDRLASAVHSELSETPTDISLTIDAEKTETNDRNIDSMANTRVSTKFYEANEVTEGLFAVIGPKGPSVYQNSEEFEKRFEEILREGLPENFKVVVPMDVAAEYCRRLAANSHTVSMSKHTESILQDWHKDCAQTGKWIAGTISAAWTWRNSMRIAGGPGVAGRTSVTRRISGGFAAGSAFAVAAWVAEGAITYALPRLTQMLSREQSAIIVTCLGGNTGIQLQSEITPSFANDIEDDGNDMHCSVQESAPGLVRSHSF